MALLETHLDGASEAFKKNAARMEGLVDELRRRLIAVREGGGADTVA
ncbi:MAG TPA: hypothetical protein VFU90_05460 [Candidatus Tumulicola sp.]|nr:hypothetical protein [Candidatus Tumulicola sp.]